MSYLSGPTTVFGLDPYSEEENPQHTVGTKGVTADGRIYRYAKAAATAISSPGRLLQAADVTGNHENISVAASASVGATSVTLDVGATTVAASEYVGGYLVVNDATGEGYTYLIVDHDASSSGSEEVTFTIKPGLKAALTVDVSEATLVRNPWMNVVVTDGDQTNIPVGVNPRTITASYYFWAQTGGVCAVQVDASTAVTAGAPVTIGDTTTGSVEVKNGASEPEVGRAFVGVTYAADQEHNPIFLTIDR